MKMKNPAEIKTAITAYVVTCMKSARVNGGRLLFAFATNTQTDSPCTLMLVDALDVVQLWQLFNMGSDGVLRWNGARLDTVRQVAKMAGVKVLATYTMGCTYREMEKNAQGDRSTVTEQGACMLGQMFDPSMEWKHIGNNHSKGWRDVVAHDADGKRAYLIEVKGRNGRMA